MINLTFFFSLALILFVLHVASSHSNSFIPLYPDIIFAISASYVFFSVCRWKYRLILSLNTS